MASREISSAEISGGALSKDGFIFVKDMRAGQRVEEMEIKSIPFASEGGLEFYKANVLDDMVCGRALPIL